MNSQELRSLQEAYIGVYDESYKELPVDKMRGKVINHAASGVKKAITPHFKGTKGNTEGNVDDAKAKKSLNKAQKIQGEIKNREALGKDFYAGSKIGRSKFKGKNVNNEAVDLYDIILSHLLDEGYADTEQAAQAIMVNMSEDWRESIVEEVLDEAEGSYGQTPKAQQKMGDLANKRRNTPASEYSERGEKKKKVDAASRHFNRMGNPDAGNRGKKSSRPYYPAGRKGMTQKDRDWSRGADEYGHSGYDGEGGGGSLPKGKKLERQRKSGVSD